MPTKKTTIGRAEKIFLPEHGIKKVHAKVDTGADLSSIWATEIREKDNTLQFKLFGRRNPHYTGKFIKVNKPDFLLTKVTNSFGHSELRYVVKFQVKIADKLVRSTFTLSDRSKKTYPILIGRRLLYKKFTVDVSKGSPLAKLEKEEKKKIEKELKELNRWEKKV